MEEAASLVHTPNEAVDRGWALDVALEEGSISETALPTRAFCVAAKQGQGTWAAGGTSSCNIVYNSLFSCNRCHLNIAHSMNKSSLLL